MGRVLTNNTALSVSIETALGVPSTIWELLEPNNINTFGAVITTTPREPISKDRQRRKGTPTDLESSVEFEHDLTLDVAITFVEGFAFAQANGPEQIQAGSDHEDLVASAGVGYGHDALTALIPAGYLVFAKGFAGTANNGLFEVDAAGSTTVTNTVAGTQTAETPTNESKAQLSVCGVRGATGDLVITVTAGVATLTTTVLDMTTLNLTVGQLIHIGGLTASEQFSAGAGYGRIVTLAANSMTLDKLDTALATDPGTGEDVDLLFGRFIRNVSTDDADFLERSYHFELFMENLQNPSGDEYEYSKGNFCNTMALSLPLTDKASVTFGFVGTDTEVPTTSRLTGADTPEEPVDTTAFNTSSDVGRLRVTDVDDAGLTTCFKSLTITLNNNVNPEKCLGTLGATFMNNGNFNVDIEAQIVFTDSAVAAAIRNNTTVEFDTILKNGDGAMALDIPSLTLGGGGKELPINESVLMNFTGQAFQDPVLGTSIGVSFFPVVP